MGSWPDLLGLAGQIVVATCGLIYELISGTLASYLLGDSVTQFSTIIGIYLFAMGIGSYLSRSNAGAGELWLKTAAADTAWSLIGSSHSPRLASLAIAWNTANIATGVVVGSFKAGQIVSVFVDVAVQAGTDRRLLMTGSTAVAASWLLLSDQDIKVKVVSVGINLNAGAATVYVVGS